MPAISPRLVENVAHVRATIDDACRRSGRAGGAVRIIAVTKYAQPEIASALIGLGLRDLGENRVQQLVERARLLGADLANWEPVEFGGPVSDRSFHSQQQPARGPSFRKIEPSISKDRSETGPPSRAPVWHMIGHLQRNKVKAALGCTRIIHSVDSIRLAEEIEHQAGALGGCVDVFLEVNVAGEASKDGAAPADAPAIAARIADLPSLCLRGLMTMAPLRCPGPAARPYFAALRTLRDDLVANGSAASTCRELSMGMSADYAVAVEEGATVVRIGSTLFEGVEGYAAPRC